MTGRVLGVAARCALAAVLLAAASATPLLGFGAGEYYEGRRFFGVIESDWLMAASLVGGAACLATAVAVLRGATLR